MPIETAKNDLKSKTRTQCPVQVRFNGYQPQFFFRTTSVTGLAEVVDNDMAMPGDGVKLNVSLNKPVALTEGARFAIREGNRTVGSGVVTKIAS